MFADDLLVIAGIWDEAHAVVSTVETWAAANNMLINRSKSGIMVLNEPAPPTPDKKLFRGYPIVSHYKYLSCTVTPALLLADHTKAIETKLYYVRSQLAPILNNGYARYNASLFRTLLIPLSD